jgi:hypothetical protein
MVDPSILTKLQGYARKFGGQLLVLTEKEFDRKFLKYPVHPVWHTMVFKRGFYEAPFVSLPARLGVQWARKIVACVPSSGIHPCGVIHEMGHVFASAKSPDYADEYEFLGWEWAMAERIGMSRAEWQLGNKDYSLEFKASWSQIGLLTPQGLGRLLADRTRAARKAGLLSAREVPLTAR